MNSTNQVHTRAIIFPAPGQVTLIERALEAPAPGQLLVRTVCTLISPGTESTVLHQRWAPGTHWERYGCFPFSPGYSLVGVVEEVGTVVLPGDAGDPRQQTLTPAGDDVAGAALSGRRPVAGGSVDQPPIRPGTAGRGLPHPERAARPHDGGTVYLVVNRKKETMKSIPILGGLAPGRTVVGLPPSILRLSAELIAGLLKPACIWLVAGVLAVPCVAQDAANWPQFRGPNSLGVAVAQEVPAKFSAKDSLNLLWKSPIKMGGISAPVVWGDKIFVTGGDTEQRQLYCYGADGKLLWTRDVKWNKPNAERKQGEDEDAATEPALREYVACNTPATDGRRVYATYGTGDVVAYDFTGQKLWAISLWPIESQYGFCSSPILYQDKLIIQLDHSRESALIALDTATGKVVWRTKRAGGDSFQSPILAETKTGAQIITATAGANNAYDPATGKELWRTSAGGSTDTPSPAYGNGIAVFVHTGDEIQAVAVDGKGDVSRTHVKWAAEGEPIELSSPVVTGHWAFVALERRIVCYDLATGTVRWEQAIAEKAVASLIAVGDKVIFISEGGKTLVFKAANKYEEFYRGELGERSCSTPAIAADRIYVRGSRNLYCFGTK